MEREALVERMLRDEMVLDNPATNEVLLDDPLEHGSVALRIPGAFRVDDGDWSAFADAQAVRFRPEDAAVLRQA